MSHPPVDAGAVGELHRLRRHGHPGGHAGPALRLQGRHHHRPGAGGGRAPSGSSPPPSIATFPALPGRPVHHRLRPGLPGDRRQPLHHRARAARGGRRPHQPGPELQRPRRHAGAHRGRQLLLSATEHADKSLANLYIPYLLHRRGGDRAGASSSRSSKVPDIVEQASTEVRGGASLMKQPHLVAAVVTQFCYVGAQIALWALFINYIGAEAPGMSAGMAAALPRRLDLRDGPAAGTSPTGAPRVCCRGRSSASCSAASAAAWRCAASARTRRWRFTALVNAMLMSAGGAAPRLDLGVGAVRQLLLHVHHVPHHLLAGHPRPGRRDQARLVVHRHGHRRRRRVPVPQRLDLGQVDGPGLHRPARSASGWSPCTASTGRSWPARAAC